jgi:hypothetical protein
VASIAYASWTSLTDPRRCRPLLAGAGSGKLSISLTDPRRCRPLLSPLTRFTRSISPLDCDTDDRPGRPGAPRRAPNPAAACRFCRAAVSKPMSEFSSSSFSYLLSFLLLVLLLILLGELEVSSGSRFGAVLSVLTYSSLPSTTRDRCRRGSSPPAKLGERLPPPPCCTLARRPVPCCTLARRPGPPVCTLARRAY